MGMGLTIALFQEVRICQLHFKLINNIPGFAFFILPAFAMYMALTLYSCSLPALRNDQWCDGWQVRTGIRDVSRETVGVDSG
jgi:hypothetical protein